MTKRMGQALEIAVFRALLLEPRLLTFGAYPDYTAHDDSTLYRKEEPPSTISGRSAAGLLDFIVVADSLAAGIEVKNVREWLYPDREEVRALLRKCTSLDLVPVLIARRIPFVTFKLLTACGAIIHQTYNQRFPLAEAALVEKAKHKDLLGYHDIRLGNEPDARLLKFTGIHLPGLIKTQRPKFEEFKDLLVAFSNRHLAYTEFAARVRRRVAGTNEDHDWDEE